VRGLLFRLEGVIPFVDSRLVVWLFASWHNQPERVRVGPINSLTAFAIPFCQDGRSLVGAVV